MPLYENAFDRMRANFERIARGDKPSGVVIGTLTTEQLDALNRMRAAHQPPLPASVVWASSPAHIHG